MTGPAKERPRGGVTRVLAKLDKSLEEGDFYEAHQMYRTLYFRYTSQGKYDDCLDLLYEGAQTLISKKQETTAADLGLLLINTLEKRVSNDTDLIFWIERLGSIIAQISASVVERETLMGRALKWTGKVSRINLGHPAMHKIIAEVFWSEKNYEQARHHYLLCRDGQLCGRVLIKIHTTKCYKNEKDLYIAQAVLQQLCLKELTCAKDTFLTYTTYHPQIRQSCAPYRLPLLNFLKFLFMCIDMGTNLSSFCLLNSLYKPSIDRDPSFSKYLSKIGVIYFNAPQHLSSGGMFGGMFGEFFSQLFQDLDNEGENNGRNVNNRPQRNVTSNRIHHELD